MTDNPHAAPRSTFVLDDPSDQTIPHTTYLIRQRQTGQLFLTTFDGITTGHGSVFDRWEGYGYDVLHIVEGEHDLETSEKSTWVRQ